MLVFCCCFVAWGILVLSSFSRISMKWKLELICWQNLYGCRMLYNIKATIWWLCLSANCGTCGSDWQFIWAINPCLLKLAYPKQLSTAQCLRNITILIYLPFGEGFVMCIRSSTVLSELQKGWTVILVKLRKKNLFCFTFTSLLDVKMGKKEERWGITINSYDIVDPVISFILSLI